MIFFIDVYKACLSTILQRYYLYLLRKIYKLPRETSYLCK